MLTHDLVELLAMLELAGKTRRGKRTRELHTGRADDVLGHHDEVLPVLLLGVHLP